jgi:hypothetical protein
MSGTNHLPARGENGSDVPRREAASFNKTLHATAVGVAVERRSVRSIILFPFVAGAHPAVRELFR